MASVVPVPAVPVAVPVVAPVVVAAVVPVVPAAVPAVAAVPVVVVAAVPVAVAVPTAAAAPVPVAGTGVPGVAHKQYVVISRLLVVVHRLLGGSYLARVHIVVVRRVTLRRTGVSLQGKGQELVFLNDRGPTKLG